jgi:hypothetical protein
MTKRFERQVIDGGPPPPASAWPAAGSADRRLLADEPGVVSFEALRGARIAGDTGGKTVLCFVAAVRPAHLRPLVCVQGLSG